MNFLPFQLLNDTFGIEKKMRVAYKAIFFQTKHELRRFVLRECVKPYTLQRLRIICQGD